LFIVDILKVLTATKIDGFFIQQNNFKHFIKFVVWAEILIVQGF